LQNQPEQNSSRLSALRVSKAHGDIQTIDQISLQVRRGEVVGVLGPNGAGKTTLMSIINGVITPDSGQILIDDHDVTRFPVFLRAKLGLNYLPQEPSVFRSLSVEDNIMIALESRRSNKKQRQVLVERILAVFGLSAVRNRNAAKLSGGMRRRCEIARAVATNPKYLMLDEPFAGVDPIAISDLQQLIGRIRGLGLGILISDHNVRETLSIVDRAYIIVAGKVLAHGNPNEIAANELVRKYYLGHSFKVAED
jgi:lipopolysaccharide export system ATP-binding protein